MKRSHNRKDTEDILNRLRNEIPDAVIRTTLIAGHPGETEKDFLELRILFLTSGLTDLVSLHIHMKRIPIHMRIMRIIFLQRIKETRVAELMEIQQNISSELNELYIGKVLKVIIDSKEGEFYIGRTEYDSPEVDQEVLIPAEYNLKTGEFYNILITESTEFDLMGNRRDLDE